LQEDRLTAQLRSSAAQFAQSGLRARLDQEWAVHQLHIATALELLAKAKLASLHGSLIAAKDFDSLLHLSGHPRHAKQPPDRIRTITITDALLRVGQVVPSVENLRSELKYLADVRNGVVHAGHLTSEAQDPEKYEQDLYDCPACGTMALVHGSHDFDWEPDWEMGDDGLPWSPGAALTVTFRPGTLECRACGLVLDGQDQLMAAEVPESWEIEDADPRDFNEPEEEW
jgi:hypothetical protein